MIDMWAHLRDPDDSGTPCEGGVTISKDWPLAERLRVLRDGRTIGQVATDAGIYFGRWKDWEDGTRLPEQYERERLARYFRLPPSAFNGDTP